MAELTRVEGTIGGGVYVGKLYEQKHADAYEIYSMADQCMRRPRVSNVTLRPITPAEYIEEFEVGTEVVFSKYGGTYTGRVTKVGRSRLTAEFWTRGGKQKTATMPVQCFGKPGR